MLRRAPQALTERLGRSFRSPLRGPWFTSVLAVVLLVGLPVVTLTGFLSWTAYAPGLDDQGRPGSAAFLSGLAVDWPTNPVWLYRLNQGLHVGLGFVLVPIVLAKLWSVLPTLFTWPAVRSPAHALERLTLLLLVGSMLLEIVTGVLNAQLFYPWPFDFYAAHYWGAWVFTGAFVSHVALKLPAMREGLRSRSLRRELGTPLAATEPEPHLPGGLAAADPAPATISRRGALAAVGGAGLLVGLVSVPQTSDRLRRLALLGPHGRSSLGLGNDFPVNKTAASRGIAPAETGDAWRLLLTGPDGAQELLSRDDLLAMAQHTYELPIACVEGWSTSQRWTGVRLRDLAALVGVPAPASLRAVSLQRGGAFREASFTRAQSRDDRSLLAVAVNGEVLHPDHGFPARVIAPNVPGVHCTKWVAELRVRA